MTGQDHAIRDLCTAVPGLLAPLARNGVPDRLAPLARNGVPDRFAAGGAR